MDDFGAKVLQRFTDEGQVTSEQGIEGEVLFQMQRQSAALELEGGD